MQQQDSVDTPLGPIKGNRAYGWPQGCPVEVLIRPDDIVIDETGDIECSVVDCAFRGAETRYTLRLPTGEKLLTLMPSHTDFNKGETVRARLQIDHLVLFQN